MKPLRLMLIEEHAAVRWALETRLASSPVVQSIDTFADLSGALDVMESLRPDIILLGLGSGKAATLRQKLEAVVRLSAKNKPIMVLVPYVDDLERELLLRVGASRYSLKYINTPQLLAEIEQTVSQFQNNIPVNKPVARQAVPKPV